jgi:hypothetical protein
MFTYSLSEFRGDQMQQGSIPFTVRVGVTGHRFLTEEQALERQVQKVVQRIRRLFPSSPFTKIALTVVSSLAEGADRLVARVIIADNGTLEVCLPLPHREYVLDFPSPESRDQFEQMLAQASQVIEVPRVQTRVEGYELAGHYVVDRSDVLIALWDGQPSGGRGGTADTIRHALEKLVPVFLISTCGDREINVDLGSGPLLEPFRECGATRPLTPHHESHKHVPLEETRATFTFMNLFNSSHLDFREGESLSRVAKEALHLPTDESYGQAGLSLGALETWIVPPFVKADAVAGRLHWWYYFLLGLEFLLASLAVATVAVQEVFFRNEPDLAFVELIFLVLLFLVFVAGRSFHVHRRWISSRFLAERLRSAFFLAATGLGDRREGGFSSAGLGRPGEEWVRRAFTYVWNHRPELELSEAHLAYLRELLRVNWIDEQIQYHEKTGRWHRRHQAILTITTIVIFTSTMVAALLHATELVHGTISQMLITLAITLPACAASIAGFAAHRQHERHAHVYAGMALSLSGVREAIGRAVDLEALRRAAAEADDIMASENRDWLGVMRFHDFELHV